MWDKFPVVCEFLQFLQNDLHSLFQNHRRLAEVENEAIPPSSILASFWYIFVTFRVLHSRMAIIIESLFSIVGSFRIAQLESAVHSIFQKHRGMFGLIQMR